MANGLWTVLNVDNVEKSVEFYKALGLKATKEKMDMPGMPEAWMGSVDVGDSGLILWSKHNVPPDQPEDTKAWVTGELGKGVLFTLGVPNAKRVWANAQKLGAEVEQALEAQPWGGNGFTIVDPDGYVVNVSDKFPGAPPPKRAKRTAKPKGAAKRAGKSAAKRAAKGSGRASKAGKRRVTSKRR